MATNGGFGFGGGDASSSASNGDVINRVLSALEIIYSPRATNQDRIDAQSFLETIKTLKEAPSHGFTLASDKAQSPIVRYYGLSLLEHSIIHKWASYETQEAEMLRSLVLKLAEHVSREDPGYIRNKIAQLWIEVAKRCWGDEWMDMDALLVQLWQLPGFGVHKELVMTILSSLSEEIIGGDDPIVALREGILDKAVVSILMPEDVISEDFPNRDSGVSVRCGSEGWFSRMVLLLAECLESDLDNEEVRSCALKALSLATVVLPWAFPKAIIQSNITNSLFRGLVSSNAAVQKV